jgi:cell division protein FtsX
MGVITHGMELVVGMFYYGTMLVSTVATYGNLNTASILPANIVTAIDGAGFFGSIGMFIVALLGVLIIIVVSITILLQVYGRFFKIYIYAAISPIALSGFAGAETSFMGKSFLKNFASVCLEGAVIMIACAVWKAIATDPKLALFVSGSTDPTTIVFQYLVGVSFTMILLAGTIKIASTIPKAALGV